MYRLFTANLSKTQPIATGATLGAAIVAALVLLPHVLGIPIATIGLLLLVVQNRTQTEQAVQEAPFRVHDDGCRDRFDSALRSYLEIEQRVEAQRHRLNNEVRARTTGLLLENRELERGHELRDEFVSLLTHELRTPLTSVRSYVELMIAYGDGVSTEERDEFLRIINQQVQRISRLVDELLDLSRIRSGKFEVDAALSSTSGVIERVVETFGEIARAQGKLLVAYSEASTTVFADPQRLDQAIGNLVSNAIKYSGDGRKIRIHVASADEQRVSIEVTDEGPGIPEDERNLVFEAFYRAQSAGQSNIQGTGLGLHLSRELIRRMGGDLCLADNPNGHGARFVIDLPAVAANAPAPERDEQS